MRKHLKKKHGLKKYHKKRVGKHAKKIEKYRKIGDDVKADKQKEKMKAQMVKSDKDKGELKEKHRKKKFEKLATKMEEDDEEDVVKVMKHRLKLEKHIDKRDLNMESAKKRKTLIRSSISRLTRKHIIKQPKAKILNTERETRNLRNF